MTFSVKLPTDDFEVARVHRVVLAGLPASFSIVDEDRPDVVVISGIPGEWCERAAIAFDEGVRAVVVHRPAPEVVGRVEELRDRAASVGLTVAIYSPYVWRRAWTEALPLIREETESIALVDSTISVAAVPTREQALRTGILEQLAVVRPLLPPHVFLKRASTPSSGHYNIAGVEPTPAISLSGVAVESGGHEELQVDFIGQRRRWRAVFTSTDSARPAEITRMDETGQHTMRPIFESGVRATWRSLFNTLEAGSPPGYGLDELLTDLLLLDRLD